MNKMLMSAALSVAVMTGAAQAETIRVGMSGGYFPFTFTEGGELKGFEVDLMNAIGEKTGDDIEFVTMGFSGLIGALGANRIDTCLLYTSPSPRDGLLSRMPSSA